LWILYLATVAVFMRRSPTFFDVVAQQSVAVEYDSVIPLARLAFEPFIGSFFALLADYSLDFWVPLSILVVYPFLRAGWRWLSHDRQFTKSSDSNRSMKIARTVLNYTTIMTAIGLGTTGAVFLLVEYYFGPVGSRGLSYQVLDIGIILTACAGLSTGVVTVIGFVKRAISPTVQTKVRSPLNRFEHEVFRFVQFLLILGVISLSALSAPLPTQEIHADLAPNEFLFDFHVHTTLSNGYLTPEERVDWYISQGINGAAFSDQLSPNGALRAQSYVDSLRLNFTVFIAQEYAAIDPKIHLNLFGLLEPITPIAYAGDPYAVNCMNTSDAIRYAKSYGGFVVVNHYIGNGNTPAYPLETLRDWGVDGFEITNAGAELDPSIREFCLANNLALIAGTDEHMNQEINAFMRVALPDPSNRSLASVFEVLKMNEHEVVLVEQYVTRFAWPSLLDPFKIVWKFTNYMLNLSPFQWGSWFLWSSSIYALIRYRLRVHRAGPSPD